MQASTISRSVAIWRLAVFATFFFNGINFASWVSRMPNIRDALHIGVDVVGFMLLAGSGGAIAGLLFAGHLVHWFGGRRVILVTLALQGVSGAIIGLGAPLPGGIIIVAAAMAVVGGSASICDVAMNVEGSGVERATGRNIMPWFHAAWSFGTVSGAGLGSAAAYAGVPIGVHLPVIGVLVVAAAVVVTRGIPAQEAVTEESAPRLTFRERMSTWLEPRTLLIGLLVLGMAFAEGSANDWLALAMVDDRGLSHGTGALLFGVFTVAMTIGRIVGVPLLDRFGRVPVLRASALASVVGLAVVILVPWVPGIVAGIVVWGLGAALGFPVGMSAAGDDPARAAARVSAVATIAYCAFLVGPPVIGVIGEAIGLLNALWIVLALIVIASLAIPAAREQRAAPAEAPEKVAAGD